VQITLVDQQEIAEHTTAFWFSPERPFTFTAGQFGSFSLVDLTVEDDGKGKTRAFSFASSPNDRHIMIATRMTGSAFKTALASSPAGTALQLMGPTGLFTLHADPARPAVFLSGGIGITPVRSICAYATEQGLRHRLYVFYANRTRAAAAFVEDFRAYHEENPNLSFIPTLTDEKPREGGFAHGPITEALLKAYLPELATPIYYVVGPPGMVSVMKKLLQHLGVEEAQIRSEDFIGY